MTESGSQPIVVVSVRSTLEVRGGFGGRSQKWCQRADGFRANFGASRGAKNLEKSMKNQWFFNVFAKLAQHGFRLPQVGLKLAQVGLKLAQIGLKLASSWPQVGSNWLQIASTWLLVGLKLASKIVKIFKKPIAFQYFRQVGSTWLEDVSSWPQVG